MNDILDTNLINPTYNPSPKTAKQVQALLSEDEAQKTRTWSYYKKLKEKNPLLYLDPTIQRQMNSDATALGHAFADNDDFND
ncbi:hypothetical protein [Bradyrhizobium quebecense]|uniref:Uncharacterized protein n=2 Tax=Bradyrhizobium quebecense TaxID=2748629 RepID=A0ACD3VF62_9BRAD|nr:hypothetical protein [Bradyrhizobium quebecense]UGY05084.1 hypothetical protein J4P68_0010255 [Bradyrhizobium quebecense]